MKIFQDLKHAKNEGPRLVKTPWSRVVFTRMNEDTLHDKRLRRG